jgi:LysM repeat protein
MLAGNVLSIWEPKEIAGRYQKIDNLGDEEHTALLATIGKSDTLKQNTSTPSWTKYQVQPGDNLHRIAQLYGVVPEDIRKWNGLRSTTIMAGQVLEIALQDSGSVPQVSTAVAQKDSSKEKKAVSYKVRRGDTLRSIASAFGVSVSYLRSLNNIRGNRILVGQEILINS